MHVHAGEIAERARRLMVALILNIVIVVVEAVAGFAANSVMLLSDALHNAGDSMGILLGLAAARASTRGATKKYTFGFKRVDILAAYTNALAILILSLLALGEALRRLLYPEPIAAGLVVPVALVAFASNTTSVVLLHAHSRKSMNVRAVYLHLMGDAATSIAVLVGALIASQLHVYIVDPLVGALISAYIAFEAFKLLKKTGEVLLEAAPLDLEKVKEVIEGVPGVRNVHHCHLWRVGEHNVHLECHVEVDDMPLSQAERLIDEIEERLKRIGVTHVTIQLETSRCTDKSLICPGQGKRVVVHTETLGRQEAG